MKPRQFIGYLNAWRRPPCQCPHPTPGLQPCSAFHWHRFDGFLLAARAQWPRDVYVGKGLLGGIIVCVDAKGLRTLEFERNSDRHTVIKPGDPAHLEIEYARNALIALALACNPPELVLVVGLGGGTLPLFRYDLGRYVEQAWLVADVVAVHGWVLRDPLGNDSSAPLLAP